MRKNSGNESPPKMRKNSGNKSLLGKESPPKNEKKLGEQKSSGERKSSKDQKSGEQMSRERKSSGERKSFGEQKSGERKSSREEKSRNKSPGIKSLGNKSPSAANSIVAHFGTKHPNEQQWKQIDKVDCMTALASIAVKNEMGKISFLLISILFEVKICKRNYNS